MSRKRHYIPQTGYVIFVYLNGSFIENRQVPEAIMITIEKQLSQNIQVGDVTDQIRNVYHFELSRNS